MNVQGQCEQNVQPYNARVNRDFAFLSANFCTTLKMTDLKNKHVFGLINKTPSMDVFFI